MSDMTSVGLHSSYCRERRAETMPSEYRILRQGGNKRRPTQSRGGLHFTRRPINTVFDTNRPESISALLPWTKFDAITAVARGANWAPHWPMPWQVRRVGLPVVRDTRDYSDHDLPIDHRHDRLHRSCSY